MVIAMFCNIATRDQRNAFLNKQSVSIAIRKLNAPTVLFVILIQQPVFKDVLLISQFLMELKFQEKIFSMTTSLANQGFQDSLQTHFIA